MWNRSGDTGAGQGAVDFLKQTVVIALGDSFCVKRVLCDSGLYQVGFIKYLETKGFTYIIAAPMSQILQKVIYSISDWKKVDKGIDVAEFGFKHIDNKMISYKSSMIVDFLDHYAWNAFFMWSFTPEICLMHFPGSIACLSLTP